MTDMWGADVPISMPEPLPDEYEVEVPMYGFGFTRYGLFFDLSRTAHEEMARPHFAPVHDPHEPVVYGDNDG